MRGKGPISEGTPERDFPPLDTHCLILLERLVSTGRNQINSNTRKSMPTTEGEYQEKGKRFFGILKIKKEGKGMVEVVLIGYASEWRTRNNPSR